MAIDRALEKRSRKDQVDALEALAERLLAKCDEADITALKELGDRIEGKPAQAIVGEEGGAPLTFKGIVEFVAKNANEHP
jgi:hypothetical protein